MSASGRRRSRGRRRERGATAALTVAALVAAALATAGGGWSDPIDGDLDRWSAFTRGIIGAALGVMVALVVVGLPGRRLLARRVAVVSLCVLVASFGFLVGVATTSPTPPGADLPADVPERIVEGSLVDLDRDGLADLGTDGRVVLVVDADGDGHGDTRVVVCTDGVVDMTERRAGGQQQFDTDCDGTLDDVIELTPGLVTVLPEAEDVPTTVPTVSVDRAPGDGSPMTSEPGEESSDGGDGLPLVVVALLVAVVGVLVVRSARRRGESDGDLASLPRPRWAGDDLPDPVVMSQAIGRSLDALLADPDPRVAITASYGALLAALADAGVPRLPYETPDAHMARCLEDLPIDPRPLRRLLLLFAVARFSTHEMTEADRTMAFDQLRAAQRELRKPTVAAGVSQATRTSPPLP